ncbi:MAG: phosphatase PAP2 family protein [Nakamurella sp.]
MAEPLPPVSYSASLPWWVKVTAGAVLAAIALYSVRRAVRRSSEIPRWVDERTYDRRGVLVPAFVAGVLLAALAALALDVEHDGVISSTFDGPIRDWFVMHRVAGLTPVVVFVTDLVSPLGSTVLAIVLATLVAWKTSSWVPALIIFIGPSAAGLLVRLTKWVAPRSRPPQLDQVVLTIEASFPSGHVAGAVSLYGCIVVVILIGFFGPVSRGRAVAAIAIATLLSLLVIFTRLYLAVHWFTDVTASVLLSGVVVCGTLAAYRQFVRTRPPVG